MARCSRRRALEISAGLGLALALALTGWFSSFCALAAQVRADTLRLHVQANSDSEADQRVKLRVRDAVLAEAEELFAGASGKAEAQAIAAENLPRLKAAAEQAAQGQPVRVFLTEMYFDTTCYETFTLPAGRYAALRVELGTHRGKNWFCVLYPALCLPAAEGEAVYPDPGEQKLVESPGVEIRFAALEWWQRLTGRAES